MILWQDYFRNAESINKHYPNLFSLSRKIYSEDYNCNFLIVDTTTEEIIEASKKIEEKFLIGSNNCISDDYPILEIYDSYRE